MTSYLADYSFARPSPAALKAAGYSAVSRYLSHDKSKNISPPEYAALEAAGLTVMLNWETTTTRALQGAAAGQDDAKDANDQADEVGYPLTAPIYFSVDTAATLNSVGPYFQALHTYSRRPVGYYGGQAVGLALEGLGYVTHLWVSNAASWSGFTSWTALRAAVDPRVHLIQHLDHPLGFDGAIDHNEILRPDFLGDDDMPLTQADITAVCDGVDAKLNRVIGTLQTNLKQTQAAILAALVAGAQHTVEATDATPDSIAAAVKAAFAKALAQS